jgi:hypothetical protein
VLYRITRRDLMRLSAGVRTPAINALVDVVRSMTGRDFAGEGRTLERLGLNGIDAPQIRRVMG